MHQHVSDLCHWISSAARAEFLRLYQERKSILNLDFEIEYGTEIHTTILSSGELNGMGMRRSSGGTSFDLYSLKSLQALVIPPLKERKELKIIASFTTSADYIDSLIVDIKPDLRYLNRV